jgi:integrase
LDQQERRGNLRPNTLKSYRSSLEQHVFPFLGSRKLQSIRIDDIANLIATLESQGYSGASVRCFLKPLNRVCQRAVRSGLLPTNPVRGLDRDELPKRFDRERRVLDSDEVPRLVSATPERYKLLILVSVLLGLRQSESLGLIWSDLRLDEGKLDVKKQLSKKRQRAELKTRASVRTVPIPPTLITLLRAHRAEALKLGEARPENFVFRTVGGGPISHSAAVRDGLQVAIRNADLCDPAKPSLTWHDLRRTAGSLLLRRGMNIVYVSRYLGHSSPEVTLRVYAKLLDSVQQDAEAVQVTESIGSVKVLENSGGECGRCGDGLEVGKPASRADFSSGSH